MTSLSTGIFEAEELPGNVSMIPIVKICFFNDSSSGEIPHKLS